MRRPKRIKPQQGQESVWDYPRPPRVERSNKHIQVVLHGVTLADTIQAWRVLETSHPPVYYIPLQDIEMDYLTACADSSWCEWKGKAIYYDVHFASEAVRKAAWGYANPTPAFHVIQNHIAFYAHLMDKCLVDGEQVRPQPGNFYGGWITSDIVGPFKGEPGTWGW